jgi:hypothetical protein
VEVFDCDVCGDAGERYCVSFPDGQEIAMDRCSKHNRKVEALRSERGTWISNGSQRSTFKVSSIEDIVKQKK